MGLLPLGRRTGPFKGRRILMFDVLKEPISSFQSKARYHLRAAFLAPCYTLSFENISHRDRKLWDNWELFLPSEFESYEWETLLGDL